MVSIKNIGLLLGILLGLNSCNSPNGITKFDVDKALDNALYKVSLSMSQIDNVAAFPRTIEKGQLHWKTVDRYDWTSGFWPGILWYAYEASGDSSILYQAEKTTEALAGILEVPVENHDLGFMLYCSYGNGQRLTKKSGYKAVIMRAADSLATLYNPIVGTTLSWPAMVKKMGWPHNTIIDNMINLELLFWASKNGGSTALYDMAVKHAETTMHHHIRPDFTTYHVAVYDTIDGHFIKGVTHQGYSDSSLWARGQAWGVYGFTMCYRETGKPEFLETAKRLADVYIVKLPDDGIPYWDFSDPSIPNAPKDASAAAVVASALLELSGFVDDKETSEKYRQVATTTLFLLSTDTYLAPKSSPAILQHSTGHWPNKSEIDVPIIYADYYYLEALLRYKKMHI